MARAFHYLGDEQRFNKSINAALDIASETKENIDSLSSGFSLDLALQFQASGYTALWKPEKAIEVHKETDRLRAFRPLRDQGDENAPDSVKRSIGLSGGAEESLPLLPVCVMNEAQKHELLKQMFIDYVNNPKNVYARKEEGVRYRCPCCGYQTLEERGRYDICPVCFWEDDGQDEDDTETNRYFFQPERKNTCDRHRRSHILAFAPVF